jgi:hypothetical protein
MKMDYSYGIGADFSRTVTMSPKRTAPPTITAAKIPSRGMRQSLLAEKILQKQSI